MVLVWNDNAIVREPLKLAHRGRAHAAKYSLLKLRAALLGELRGSFRAADPSLVLAAALQHPCQCHRLQRNGTQSVTQNLEEQRERILVVVTDDVGGGHDVGGGDPNHWRHAVVVHGGCSRAVCPGW